MGSEMFHPSFNHLLHALTTLNQAEGRHQHLDLALGIRNKAVGIKNIESSLKATILGDLSLTLCTKLKKTAELGDIRKAVDHLEQAICKKRVAALTLVRIHSSQGR